MKFKKIISVISAAVMAVSALSVSAVPVSAANDTDSWKTVYSKYLKNKIKKMDPSIIPEDYKFSVNDLDDNGTPELILSEGPYHYVSCDIYTCKDGKLKKLGSTGSNGVFDYDPVNNVIESSYTGMGVVSSTLFKMKNGKMSRMIYFLSYNSVNGESFLVSDKEVSKATYEKYTKKYAMASRITLGRDYSLTETDIKCATGGYKNYKSAYKAFIADRTETAAAYATWSDTYTVKDITGDKIPELFYNISPCKVYTFKDGRMQYLGAGDAYGDIDSLKSCLAYCKAQKTLMFVNKSNQTTKTFCKIKDGYLIQEAKFSYEQQMSAEAGGFTARYRLDDKDVSKSEYNKALKKYSKMKFITVGKPTVIYGLDKDNIII